MLNAAIQKYNKFNFVTIKGNRLLNSRFLGSNGRCKLYLTFAPLAFGGLFLFSQLLSIVNNYTL